MTCRFLRLPDVRAKVGLSRSTIYLRMSRGQFPKTVKLGERSVAWIDSDIDDWIEQRINESSKEQGATL